ncbi:MAG: tRNA lysidine(34) synthetase TilS [Clostridiales bacterium]|nr:tRNA lysidine(34) synthetase TilS [Clostridiales bacterium]
MSKRQDLFTQTREYLLSEKLMRPGQQVVVAVSAGRDSCVMLHILHNLSAALDFTLVVAHFDHQLRQNSAAEQQFAGELAAGYGLPFYGGRADVRALAGGDNLEDAARRARYAFLRETALKTGAAKIATAHHARDQAETVLLHLLRGSGLEGLAAMSPKEGDIIRPLLSALPEQIEDHRALHDLRFCKDESNDDTRYLRNHIRLKLLPKLLEINPRLLQSLSATADICREDNMLLAAWAGVALDELRSRDGRSVAEGYFALPPALQRRIVRMAFAQVAGDELSFAQTEAVRALKEEQRTSGPGGWLIYRRGALFIEREHPGLPEYREVIPLKADGKWHKLAGWGWKYMAEHVLKGTSAQFKEGDIILLPAEMEKELAFRTRRQGDSIFSMGKAGRHKVKDIFIDAKIPQYLRAGWPLLTAKEDIIWLPRLYKRVYRLSGHKLIIIAKRIIEE